jgi:prepilin-type N-terminal cleavage/methylation domain-containing protein
MNCRDVFPHRGFTLLEVLIAVFVAATALLAIWKLHGQVVSLVPGMRFQSVAPFLAEKTLAELDAMPREKHVSGHCETADHPPGISCDIQIEWMDDKHWEKIGTSVEKIDIRITGPADVHRFQLRAYRFYPINKGKGAAAVSAK